MKIPLFEINDRLICDNYGDTYRISVIYEDTPEKFEYKLINKHEVNMGIYNEETLLHDYTLQVQ